MKPQWPWRVRYDSPLAGLRRAVVIPPAWPPQQAVRQQWLDFGSALASILMPDRPRTIAALQLWHLHEGGAARTLGENARHWNPDFGLGVWLDEPPPSLWTEDELLRTPPGARLRPPLFQLVRLQPQGGDLATAWRHFGGGNIWLALAVRPDPESFLAREAPRYREWVTDASLQAFDWCLPLLRARCAHADLLEARLHHLEALDAYLRESEEDGGLVVWAKIPLEPVFDQLGVPAADRL